MARIAMEALTEVFDTYGYAALVLLGFVEFLGLPVAAAPVLMLAGAASIAGAVNPFFAVLSVVAGALVSESVWFGLARWRGRSLVDMACGLASNPNLCVLSFAKRMTAGGARLLVAAKFIPGGGSVPAFAAGLAGLPYRRFVAADAFGLVLWSATYIAVGGFFHDEVDALVTASSGYVTWLAWGLVLVFAAALAWRVRKGRRHAELHEAHRTKATTVDAAAAPCQSAALSR